MPEQFHGNQMAKLFAQALRGRSGQGEGDYLALKF